jgi:hypothetical protein
LSHGRLKRRKVMSKKFLSLILSLLTIALVAGSAMGATLRNSQGNTFGTGNDVTNSYRIAYEVYSETAGVSTIADNGVSIGQIDIVLTQPLNAGETANLVIPSGAVFNAAGPNYKFGLCDVGVNNTCDPGEIIGVVPTAGVTTNNLGFSILNAPAGTTLRVVQWADTNGNNQYDIGEALLRGVGIYVHPGLGATCTNRPIIKVDFSTPHETTPQSYNFAYITPQFTSVGPTPNDFTAELDTDTDFKTFIVGSSTNVATPTQINDTNFFTIVNSASAPMWIAYAVVSPQGNIQFKLNSAISEPGVNLVQFDGNNCITTDQKTWQCSVTGVSLVGPHTQLIQVTGTSSNNPTNWTLTDFAMTVTTIGLRNLCIAIPPSSVGVWYGGVEAIVPFVKSDPAVGAQTYIIFYNRRDVDVPVYARAMLQDSAPIVISAREPIATIPAHGQIKLTADQLQSLLPELAGYNMANGVPIKFMFRVPSQSLTNNISLTGNVDLVTGAAAATGTLTNVNPFDPYIDGIVVSIYGTQQRSVPLKFKFFKQGSYNE